MEFFFGNKPSAVWIKSLLPSVKREYNCSWRTALKFSNVGTYLTFTFRVRVLRQNLSPAVGRGIDYRNRVSNWVAKLHRLAGRYENPMPFWFLAPIAGLKLLKMIPDTDWQGKFKNRFQRYSMSRVRMVWLLAGTWPECRQTTRCTGARWPSHASGRSRMSPQTPWSNFTRYGPSNFIQPQQSLLIWFSSFVGFLRCSLEFFRNLC